MTLRPAPPGLARHRLRPRRSPSWHHLTLRSPGRMSSRRSITTSTQRTGSRWTCWTAIREAIATWCAERTAVRGSARGPSGTYTPSRAIGAALVAGLASQTGRQASAATDVTLDGFTGKFMELTVPARIDLAGCDDGEFRTWGDPMGGARNPEPGQPDR